MTKDEIKLIKEQQRQIERSYEMRIRQLEGDINAMSSELMDKDTYIKDLKDQIRHLQSCISGDFIANC